jgi:hypothetical protein
MLCCPTHTINTHMSPLQHEQITINSITYVILSISLYKYPYITLPSRTVTNQFHYQCFTVHLTLHTTPYVTPPKRSVTNQFHYKCYAVHITLKVTLYHPSRKISYQSMPLPMLCCPTQSKIILMLPLQNDQIPIHSITNIMLSTSHYIHP